MLLLQRLLTNGNEILKTKQPYNNVPEENINLGSRLIVVSQRLINIGASEAVNNRRDMGKGGELT